jgi:hypothetical protein
MLSFRIVKYKLFLEQCHSFRLFKAAKKKKKDVLYCFTAHKLIYAQGFVTVMEYRKVNVRSACCIL